MFFALYLVLFVITIAYSIYKYKYERIVRLTKDIPSPPALPIIGHALHFVNKTPEEILLKFRDFVELCGDTVKVWLGTECNIFFGNVKDIEVILGSTKINDKSDHYVYLDGWLCEGLLVSRGKKWFQRRKILTPAFHFKVLDQFLEIFQKESRELVVNLRKQAQLQKADGVNLYDWINLCTLDTICETAMGVSINAQRNVDSEYVRAVKTISTVLHKRMFNIFYRSNFTYQLTPMAREERHALKVLHDFTDKIILQRRDEILKHGGEPKLEVDVMGVKKKMAFLDILLQSEINGKPLSNLDIREEVDTFMFEGHDTTSSAINFFFYNIATHPASQQKCFDEVLSVFGTEKFETVTIEQLSKLHYVELCIKETLRLFPSVPLLGRKVMQDCEINGKLIPRGVNVAVSPLGLGRNAELFPEPNSFLPERFDGVSSASKLNPYAYIPFSAGPRNCIGQKFAMLEMKCIIANVLRNFEFEYIGEAKIEDMVLQGELILRARDPIMFKIKERK